jgi:hypothetical protein
MRILAAQRADEPRDVSSRQFASGVGSPLR